jgi:sugar phosphate isomerase/epimerase
LSSESNRLPRFSISQVSTLTASFPDDVRTYADSGVDAIGIWELKLGEGPDDEALDLFRASGLGAASAVSEVPSILPLLPGPDDPRERIDSLLRSIHRLAALDRAGWNGYYDLEIFSDNGAFGSAYPDSLWDLEPAELVRRARESFARCWQERQVAA